MRHHIFSSVGIGLAVLGIAAPLHSVPTPEPVHEYAAVDGFLRESTEANNVPGLAYAIVTPDSVAHVGAMGTDGNGRPVTGHTPFLWGSVSKPVTATAVMTLVESGALELDEPVRTYLPSFQLADADVASRITVRQLLEQTSGIPQDAGITDRFDRGGTSYREAVADLAEAHPNSAPGERHGYTSANYLVLGAVVEEASGLPFADYLSEHVLEPLRMDDVVASLPDAEARLTPGHGYAFGQPVEVPLRYDPTGQSYGYLGGSLTDLASFAMAQLNGGRYGSAPVLEGESVELMQAGAVRLSDTQRYGLGWRDDDRNADLGTRTVWHAGAAPGYQAMIVLLPDLDLGVVVLQNIYGFFQDAQLAATGLGAARLLAGGQPSPAPTGPMYALTLAGLIIVLAGIVVAIGWPVYRLFRPGARPLIRKRVVVWTTLWVLAAAFLAYVTGVVLPRLVGTRLDLITLWAPDAGWLLVAVVVACGLLGAAWLVSGLVRFRRTPDSSPSRNT